MSTHEQIIISLISHPEETERWEWEWEGRGKLYFFGKCLLCCTTFYFQLNLSTTPEPCKHFLPIDSVDFLFFFLGKKFFFISENCHSIASMFLNCWPSLIVQLVRCKSNALTSLRMFYIQCM